jgi:hypothetical protein
MANQLQFFRVATVSVGAIGATGEPTNIVGKQTYDQRAYLLAAAPGIHVSDQKLRLTSAGCPLPTGQWIQMDIPAGYELNAISAAGSINLGLSISPVLEQSPGLLEALTGLAKALNNALPTQFRR